MFFYTAVLNIHNPKQIKNIIFLSTISMTIAAAYGIFQHYVLRLPRVNGFAHALAFGCLLAIFILFTLIYGLWGKFNWLRSYFTPIKENNTVIGANIVIDDITDNKTFEYDLKEKVFRDPLTRAYNRHALENKLPSRLSEVKLKGTISCIAIVDIDNFKEINDNFGHKAGDAVLKYLATRVKKEYSAPKK